MPTLLLGCFSLSVLAADDRHVYVDTTPYSDGYINHSVVLDTRMGVAISSQVIHERRSGASAQGMLNVWDLSIGQGRERVLLPSLAFEMTMNRDRHLLAVVGGPGNQDDTEPLVLIYDYEKRRVAYKSPRPLKPSRQDAAAF